ncbi:class I SAM-dependent methyltransferase [Ornithinimicrobium tianjinense]|uniref:class I SAM-dependent methyltransferase n=1 Tax=Ornithinimicrobium tianjinense TaxID=1195761 RepID=UPI001E5399A1|nr:class I SAM-dependent methyltransferase [Ornithinimicrobium tianjinense]
MTDDDPAPPGPGGTAALMARLAAPEGRALLASLPRYDEGQVIALSARLRAEGVDPALVSAALTQSRLRARARDRLGPLADTLLLTTDGLEQATRTAVAERHAQRFVEAGVQHVWDLGSGLGLDALALARAGLAVTAVERDETVAVAAAANLAPYPRARVVQADATTVEVPPGDGAWLDPARRRPGVADARGRTRRLFRLSELTPSWEHVRAVGRTARATGAKLSPGFSAADLPTGAEAEWVSVDGEVVECVVWWGGAVRRPGVSAVVGAGGSWVTVRPAAAPPEPLTAQDQVGPWLAEPDRAVLAAGLAPSCAEAVGGRELDADVGYVSAPAPVALPWVRWFAVDEVLPLHAKVVRAWLRERGIARVTLKKRGVPTDPDRFRADLRLRGGRGAAEATLVLTRVAGTPSAIVVRPAAPGR